MPLDEKTKVFVCDECNARVDGSCARKSNEKIVCDSCVRKKTEFVERIRKREEQRWDELRQRREGS
jgi:hypothetical protein